MYLGEFLVASNHNHYWQPSKNSINDRNTKSFLAKNDLMAQVRNLRWKTQQHHRTTLFMTQMHS